MKDLDFDNLDFSMMGTIEEPVEKRKFYYIAITKDGKKFRSKKRPGKLMKSMYPGLVIKRISKADWDLYGRQGYTRAGVFFGK
jgi:hypothetical protein